MINYHNFTICITNYYTSNIIPNILIPLCEFQLKHNSKLDIHIYNNSPDDKIDNIIRRFSDLNIKIYASNKNIGYPSAIYELHKKIDHYDYVFFINPDCIFDTTQLEQFIDKLKNKSFGAVVCNITNGLNGPEYSGIATITDNNRISYDLYAAGYKFAMGAFVLYDIRALDHVGSFNKDYFMYWEDVDISARLQQSGYKIISIKLDTPIKHLVGYCSKSLWMKIKSRYFFYKGLYIFRKIFKKGEAINNVEYI